MATVRHLLDRRFNGYLGIKLPHELDDLVESVVAGYLDATPAVRQETLDAIQPRAAGVLCVFGQRMATMAVRTDSTVPLYRGIVGMGMAERTLDDPRDSLFVLATVNHSARTLGTTITRLATDVRRHLPEPAYERFLAFDLRTERDKSLPAFGLAAYGSGAEFRYGHGSTLA
ncbi:hypothetical protein ADK67_24705 [Saccharothrix sp. NRRL B-16348]|uniref:hypothetical protein n=1 Tax=Saccharothrix sp. NRRL B-16348 TaxID=1415542 RepID=UPI0006B03759|nr:hypothetical protein [Saccharothrix sp. NRRL B-16348]KOX22408.1 hypothetical protein ADK67_24705 [Saccharothrix sp. NRRL B-16348]